MKSYLFSEADKKLLDSSNRIDPSKLNPEQLEVFNNSNSEPDSELVKLAEDGSVVAKYKIQITFNAERTKRGLAPCVLSFWRSMGALSEHNDDLLYICKYERDPRIGCGFPFLEESKAALVNGAPMSLFECKQCNRLVNRDTVCSEIYLKMPYEKLADTVYKYFRAMNSDADLYVKYFRLNLRKDEFNESKADYCIYPVSRLIKDATVSSAQTVKNIAAFLGA